jgi:hypothetical protein
VHPKSTVFAWPMEFLFCPRMELWLATERSFLTLSRHLTLGGTLDLRRDGGRRSRGRRRMSRG